MQPLLVSKLSTSVVNNPWTVLWLSVFPLVNGNVCAGKLFYVQSEYVRIQKWLIKLLSTAKFPARFLIIMVCLRRDQFVNFRHGFQLYGVWNYGCQIVDMKRKTNKVKLLKCPSKKIYLLYNGYLISLCVLIGGWRSAVSWGLIIFLCIARFASDRDGFVRVIVRIKKMSYRKKYSSEKWIELSIDEIVFISFIGDFEEFSVVWKLTILNHSLCMHLSRTVLISMTSSILLASCFVEERKKRKIPFLNDLPK